ncbi:glycosyltransferase [Jatrophihabitans sp.]|uniref:glycosyltransferase n=1 Tax=Jatrophihabitans sp. TaxID=1932789 RepID=UPI0030C71B31
MGVLIPARDEADYLAGCLRSVAVAAAASDLPVRAVVVLDSCTDESATVVDEVATELALDLVVLTSSAGSVGAARRAGARELLRWSDPAHLWLASTDADSAVPAHWLTRQLRHAADGADLVAGTVEVEDWSQWPRQTRATYERQYARHTELEGHGHVHGANLGIRGDVYRRIGGFAPAARNEDVELISRARRHGVEVTWALDLAVSTSSRRIGRAPNGFAGHLVGLATGPDETS